MRQTFFAILALLLMSGSSLVKGAEEPRESAAADSAVSGEPVELPFGFTWGQTKKDIRHLLAGVGVRIVNQQTLGHDRKVWALEGFIKPLLKDTRVYFTGDFMEEVELQFGEDRWQDVDYIRLRRKLVAQLNKLYGSSRMIGSETSREDGVAQSLIGYEWISGDTRLRLFDFGARKDGAHYRRISVHYRFYDRYQVAEETNRRSR